jgi:hypothetical protein
MNRLNPFDKVRRANEQKQIEERTKQRKANQKKDRKAAKKAKAARRKAFNAIQKGMAESFDRAEVEWLKVGGGVVEEEEGEEDEQ